MVATTGLVEAITGAQYAIHAVPVQHSRKFLESIAVRALSAWVLRRLALDERHHQFSRVTALACAWVLSRLVLDMRHEQPHLGQRWRVHGA